MCGNILRLSTLEKRMHILLMEIAAGIKRNVCRTPDGVSFYTDYETFAKRFKVSKEELVVALSHITEYDWQQDAPLLESLMLDDLGNFLGCPCYREGFEEQFHKCKSISKPFDFWGFKHAVEDEIKMAEWYWRVNKDIPERLEKAIKHKDIIADEKQLMNWTMDDIAGIAMRNISRRQYIPIKIRYIITDDQPRFGYANYGDFFFYDNKLYVIVDNKEEYQYFRHRGMETWLCEQAAICPMAKDGLLKDAIQIAQKRIANSVVIEVLFAGMSTPLKDCQTGTKLFTGDVISVLERKEATDGMTAGLSIMGDEHKFCCLPLDNHCFPLDPHNSEQRYLKRGTAFYDLSMMDHELSPHHECLRYVPQWVTDETEEMRRMKAKAAPCYHKDDWEWKAAALLGLYNE